MTTAADHALTTLADGNAATPARVADPPVVRRSGTARLRAVLAAYLALTKPRIIELLLVTTVPTMVLAARGLPPLGIVLATLVGGSLAAGSANTLNSWYDRDIDVVMQRTERRPLARQAVPPRNALLFGLALGVLAVALLAVSTNALSAALAAAAMALYVVGYTMVLKRRTSQNIVWGGAAGCMPVLIGWSAVTGTLSAPAVVLFLVVFLWTPPHFWALAMRFREDYAAASVPMLPVVASASFVAGRIVVYSWAMVVVSLLLVWPLGVSGAVYGVAALAVGAVFLREAHLLLGRARRGVETAPMRLFHTSISYLALLFLAVAVDQLL